MPTRTGWETNSSSSHSLVLADLSQEVLVSAAQFGLVEDGELIVFPTRDFDFGWDWLTYDDPVEKMQYLLLDGFDLNRMSAIVCSKLGVRSVKFPMNEKGELLGYIDHQSVGITSDIRAMSDDQVWNFITGNSSINTGNDNDTAY